jgi:predicted nucleotidyltransferase
VLAAALRYAEQLVASDGRVVRVSLVGSYARADYGPGSDADLLVVLSRCEVPFLLRPLELPASRLLHL